MTNIEKSAAYTINEVEASTTLNAKIVDEIIPVTIAGTI